MGSGVGSGENGTAPTPGAARTVGSLAVPQAPLTVASVLRQPGHPGAAGRGVAAAAKAGGEPALLPQLSRGKSRPGQEAAGGQRTVVPQGRSILGVGGTRDGGRWGCGSSHPWLGAALCPTGLGTPPARPISAATGERLGSGRGTSSLAVQGGGSGGCLRGHWGVRVVTAAPSPPQGAKPPGAGQGGPWGRGDKETEVGIAAAGRAGAGPR